MSVRTVKAFGVLLFGAACVLFYFGTTMLFLVPGNPGEESTLAGYLRTLVGGRFLFGTLPTLSAVCLLLIAGYLWSGLYASASKSRVVLKAFALAGAAIALFWIGSIAIADFRVH